jgi:polysaccharide export outer membrane protein
MRAFLAVFMAVLLTLFAAIAAVAQGSYQIQPGDSLRVEVLEDASLNRSVLVLPDGQISFPLAGTVRAAGLSVSQVERAIASRIAPNFANPPNVFVSVIGIPPKEELAEEEEDETIVVYVVGEVNEPGPKAVLPGTTVLQLLSQAGGFTQFAATKRLQLRRKDAGSGREKLFQIDYRAISRGASLSSDPVLREGDVLLIPERRLFE